MYESRPGDVISLGATSWRITEITHDRVLVVPAPGQPARLPFWRGDGVGRPAELGAAVGAFTGELARLSQRDFEQRCHAMGFDDYAIGQSLAAARRPAAGHRRRADRHHVRRRAVPRRARRLAGDPALPVRAAGARPAGAGGLPPAARALRHRREADRLRRRHHRATARHRGHPAGRGSVRLRRRRDRADRHRRGRRLGAVRIPVPRMRRPRTAAAAPPPGQAVAAVASAAACRATARRGPQVPRLPDRARGGARMPAGRLRRARR